jgi:hypothetical protein
LATRRRRVGVDVASATRRRRVVSELLGRCVARGVGDASRAKATPRDANASATRRRRVGVVSATRRCRIGSRRRRRVADASQSESDALPKRCLRDADASQSDTDAFAKAVPTRRRRDADASACRWHRSVALTTRRHRVGDSSPTAEATSTRSSSATLRHPGVA